MAAVALPVGVAYAQLADFLSRPILVAVILAILRFVHVTSRPRVECLGEIEGLSGCHSIARHPGARTEPGLLLFRFNVPRVFFNAPYFKPPTTTRTERSSPVAPEALTVCSRPRRHGCKHRRGLVVGAD